MQDTCTLFHTHYTLEKLCEITVSKLYCIALDYIKIGVNYANIVQFIIWLVWDYQKVGIKQNHNNTRKKKFSYTFQFIGWSAFGIFSQWFSISEWKLSTSTLTLCLNFNWFWMNHKVATLLDCLWKSSFKLLQTSLKKTTYIYIYIHCASRKPQRDISFNVRSLKCSFCLNIFLWIEQLYQTAYQFNGISLDVRVKKQNQHKKTNLFTSSILIVIWCKNHSCSDFDRISVCRVCVRIWLSLLLLLLL